MTDPMLEIDGVSKHFQQETGLEAFFTRDKTLVRAVDDIDLQFPTGEIHGIVGESGCGKTTLAKVIMGIHEPTAGEIRLNGKPASKFDKKDFYTNIQMVFQDPFNSHNPRMKVKTQLAEPLIVQGIENKSERICDALKRSGLRPPENYLDEYPHELSGGQRQRVAIARALVLEPRVIVADEPVSMLDVSVRAGILDVLEDLASDGITIVYISHDIATIKQFCDKVSVMFLGRIVETGDADAVFDEPLHPYSERLRSATPSVDPEHARERVVLEDELPDPTDLPTGCYFKDRCAFATEACKKEEMSLRRIESTQQTNSNDNREVACHRSVDDEIDWSELESSDVY